MAKRVTAALLAFMAPAALSAAQPVAPSVAPQPRLFIAGDSTAQTYPQARYPQSGWGQYLACGLVDGTHLANRAIAARSTRTFIGEGRWDQLMADIRPGDTVLIQFGHNDAARNKPERFADPTTTFRDNLLRMVWETRGRQAVPVLITPVIRRSIWEDGKAHADFAEWSAVTRTVAAQTGTALIDLEASSRALVDSVGAQQARALYLHYPPGSWPAFPKGIADDTHFSEIGARRIAGLVAAGLAALPIPAAALVLPDRPDLERNTPLGTGQCH